MREIVLVVGQGYVDLPLALRAVEAGYDVLGYDVDQERTKALAGGVLYVEDISDDDVAGVGPSDRALPGGVLTA